MNRRLLSLALALSLTAGLCLPAGATLGESGEPDLLPARPSAEGSGFDYEPAPAPEGRTAMAALFAADVQTEAITVSLNNNNPELITGFTVAAVPAGGGEALYGVRQGTSWDYKIPFSTPPQEDTDYTITVTAQSSAPGFHEAGVKETAATYNAIKSLTIKNGEVDATGKTLYLQTNNAQGRQSVQLTTTKNGSSGSTGSTGHPYMRANDYAEQVQWTSSNEAVASVDATGLVTAHTGGTATITASVYGGRIEATCTVNVSAVTGVSLSHTTYSLFTGGTASETQFTLSAALTGGVSSDELEWTNSNPNAAAMSVAADGRSAVINASGKTAGSTTITAHIKGAPDSSSYKASCTVTVVTIGSVSVSPANYTIYTLGEPRTVQFTATVTPNAAPVWASSNPAAAAVNQTGLVTAIAPGSTTVTATVGGKSGNSTITVKEKIPVTSVTVSGTNSLVRTSDKTTVTTQLSASVEPENATLKTVTWAKTGGSADINISTSGLVTATAAGSATFTATADGLTSTPYTVTVTDQGPTGITISAAAATVTVGKTTALSATVTPANAFNTNVTWKSSNPAVATVSPASTASGVNVTITGVVAGSAIITATAAGNTGKSAACTVTVKPSAPVDDNGNVMEEGNMVLWAGRTWWVVDGDGSQYGGDVGSVVLLANFDYAYCVFGSSNAYSSSTARTQCNNFYNSLTAAEKSKLSKHKYVGDYVWLPSTMEIYGDTPSWTKENYTETKQFEYFADRGVTSAGQPNDTTAALYFKNNIIGLEDTDYRWLRTATTGYTSAAAVYKDGRLNSQQYSRSAFVRPCVILNPSVSGGGDASEKTITWAGRDWWVVDGDGSQYGGDVGSVVLLANFDYAYCVFGSSNAYSGSTARTQCNNFYNSLTAAEKSKLSKHKYVGDYVWLPSTMEIYGDTPSWTKENYTETKQFEYFADRGVTSAGQPNDTTAALYFKNNIIGLEDTDYRWLRTATTGYTSVAAVYKDGRLNSQQYSRSAFVRPCVILNP